jgi:hypothetical protein
VQTAYTYVCNFKARIKATNKTQTLTLLHCKSLSEMLPATHYNPPETGNCPCRCTHNTRQVPCSGPLLRSTQLPTWPPRHTLLHANPPAVERTMPTTLCQSFALDVVELHATEQRHCPRCMHRHVKLPMWLRLLPNPEAQQQPPHATSHHHHRPSANSITEKLNGPATTKRTS